MNTWSILHGHVLDVLRGLPSNHYHCVVTSPPYWGLRSYGTEPQVWGGDPTHVHEWGVEQEKRGGGGQPGEKQRWQHRGQGPSGHPAASAGAFCACGAWRGELGLEPTPELYVEHMVAVFREVRRVLRPDGTLWLNLGDCYATGAGAVGDLPGGGKQGARWRGEITRHRDARRRPHGQPTHNGRGEQQVERTRATRDGSHAGKHTAIAAMAPMTQPNRMPLPGLKPKDMVGIPWRVAFALQADGWWLRSEIIFAKPNPMPESVTDRPTKAHEQVFLLAKSERYFYDAEAIKEPATDTGRVNGREGRDENERARPPVSCARTLKRLDYSTRGRNARSVWTIATAPFAEAHFATFPPALAERCILAGTSDRGTCAECGAPWARVMERTGHVNRREPAHAANNSPTKTDSTGWAALTRDSGRWAPTCACSAPAVPCRVLDPFGGAGTVAVVGLNHSRDVDLVELQPEYVDMARRRIRASAPALFSSEATSSDLPPAAASE